MSFVLRAFMAAFVLVHLFAPQWARAAGLDVWELPTAVEDSRLIRTKPLATGGGFGEVPEGSN